MENRKLNAIDLELLHCCARRGVKLNITVAEKLSPERIRPLEEIGEISQLYLDENGGTGFFKFFVAGVIAVSGTLHSSSLTILYPSVRSDGARRALPAVFEGYGELMEAKFGR